MYPGESENQAQPVQTLEAPLPTRGKERGGRERAVGCIAFAYLSA